MPRKKVIPSSFFDATTGLHHPTVRLVIGDRDRTDVSLDGFGERDMAMEVSLKTARQMALYAGDLELPEGIELKKRAHHPVTIRPYAMQPVQDEGAGFVSRVLTFGFFIMIVLGILFVVNGG